MPLKDVLYNASKFEPNIINIKCYLFSLNFNLLFLISFTAGFLSSGSITKGLPPPPDDYDDDSIGGIPMDEGGGPDFGGCYGDDVEPHLPRESYIPALANNEQGQPAQVRRKLELYVHCTMSRVLAREKLKRGGGFEIKAYLWF